MAKIYGQLERAQLENLAADPAGPAVGQSYYNTATGEVRAWNGSVWLILGTTVGAQVVTNKKLDDSTTSVVDTSDNTKTIKFDAGGTTGTSTTLTGAQTANRTITLPDATTTLVGADATQALTNKDIDGGTASNAKRVTLPKDTLANITGLTRKEGTLLYSTDQGRPYIDTGSALTPIALGASLPNISILSKTSAYTLTTSDDLILLNASGGAFTVTLPSAASASGHVFQLVKHSSDTSFNAITLSGTIDGVTNPKIITPKERLKFVSDGTSYYTIEHCTDTGFLDGGLVSLVGVSAKGTTSIDKCWIKREGDSARFRLQFKQSTGATSSGGSYGFTFPYSLAANTSKVTAEATSSGLVASGKYSQANDFNLRGYISGTTTVIFYRDTGGSLGSFSNGSAESFSAGAANFILETVIPMTDWWV